MSGSHLLLSRRELLARAGVGVASLYLGGCAGQAVRGREPQGLLAGMPDFGPLDRTLGDVAPRAFSGDHDPEGAHAIFWNKVAFLAERFGGRYPASTEEHDVVIVGGGMSGLLSAYFLKDLKPVILERAPRFGGNSRGESWRGIEYSLATAYFGVPTEGSPIHQLFTDIGLQGKYRHREVNDPVFVDGKRYDGIWENGTVPESKAQFVKLGAHVKDVLASKNGLVYPDVPIQDPKQRKYIEKLDRMDFMSYVKEVVGGELHPHLERVIEHYFWSASATSAYEVSAAGGLNFFAADFGSMAIAPGGNGGIAEAILDKLTKEMPLDRFRPGSPVVDVKTGKDRVRVSYVDASGQLRVISAKTVIMCCPKFIAAKVIGDLDDKRLEAISRLKYHSYLVANVLVNQPLKDDFYDLFFFSEEQMKLDGTIEEANRQRVTDVVYGNFAEVDPERTILTLFRGFPFDGARYQLYQGGAYDRFRGEFEAQLNDTVLPMLKLKKDAVVDMRIARWGHPLPLNEKGLIADGTIDRIRKPHKKRVFFVEQDNWMLPAFETCFYEAKTWTGELRKVLKG